VGLLYVSQYRKKGPQIVNGLEKILKSNLVLKYLILNLLSSNDFFLDNCFNISLEVDYVQSI
jgi:hypothetical protein